MKKGCLKKETESTIVAVQDQALCTRNMRNGVYEENVQSMCRVSGVADETVPYIVSEWSKLVHKEYKQVRHDSVANILYWKLCEKWGFSNAEKWYIHKSEKVLESDECNIL